MTNEDILKQCRERLPIAVDAVSHSRRYELDDLRFVAGSPDNQWQWPNDVLGTRGSVQGQSAGARPCLTINKLPQHVRQITNDQRQNRPAGKVIPVDDQADVEVAEILDGIVRHIEYISDADVAYDTACECQVQFGEGYFRILTEYCDDTTFDQDIKIGRIRNAFSVYIDPNIQDPCGSDARYGFITQDIPRDEYESSYPEASIVSAIEARHGVGDDKLRQWVTEETVRVAEYFYVESKPQTVNLYPGGAVAVKGTPEDVELIAQWGKPLKSRESESRTVQWVKTNGYEILEQSEWPGKYIPIIRVVGNEYEVDGELHVSGIIRNAKDPQRLYNYWASQEAEMLALAPKAPFIGYAGQFEGFEEKWKTANTVNWPYLEVNMDATDSTGAALPLPQRSTPPMPQTAIIQAKMGAAEDIKSVTGQYDASIGAQSNERSGKAIIARERQSDTGSYHYVDNLARAIRYGVRQIVDLIPKIYDTQRIARIVGIDGEVSHAKIDPTQSEPVRKYRDANGSIQSVYNPSIGTYDVRVSTGPSYMTKRQEALDAMTQIMQANPAIFQIAGDLIVKNMDWPGAEELAERIKRTIDPKLLGDDKEGPTPEQMQIQAMGQQMDQMKQMIDGFQQSLDAREVKVKEYEAETKRMQAVQAGMSPEQIQEIVLGTVHGMITSGDLIAETPPREPEIQPEPMQEPMQGPEPQPMEAM